MQRASAKTFIACSSALGKGINTTLLKSSLHPSNQEKGKYEQAIGSILENMSVGEETSAVLTNGVTS